MIGLAQEITKIIVDEYGRDEFLRRISDPFWFQALGCVLGYDWHSSGVTTVLTGVLKNALKPEEHGLAICGGKGKASMQTRKEICQIGEKMGFSTDRIENLQHASRMSAKVDNTAVQAGYVLYHHAFVMIEGGKWAVVQQGMSIQDRTARRYHWLSDHVQEFVVEPHEAIVGEVKRKIALDMTARQSENCRKISTDIVKDQPKKLMRLLGAVRPVNQTSLKKWMSEAEQDECIKVLSMPRNLNWKAMRRAYEFQPENYEQLLSVKGVGPATVRGLALIAELVYGASPSWKDPVKYSFAYGGKDGVPFPVERKAMDESIQILEDIVKNAKIGDKEKLRSLQRLRKLVPPDRPRNPSAF